jgi:hypothetical protein
MNKKMLFSLGCVFLGLTACNAPSSPSSDTLQKLAVEGFTPIGSHEKIQRTFQKDALLFTGSGTWPTEVTNLENIMDRNGTAYDEASSAELNSMSVDELAAYGTIIFPGGNGATEANSLTVATQENLRAAIRERGLGYVGFCAGAFIAQAPAPTRGVRASYGLSVVTGPELKYYYLEDQGHDIAMTLYKFADGSTADILYYGGPVVPDCPGGVVAQYPNGQPSISETWSGNGLVVISGGHPTSSASTLADMGVSSSDGTHQDVAWNMIHAAIAQEPLPAF